MADGAAHLPRPETAAGGVLAAGVDRVHALHLVWRNYAPGPDPGGCLQPDQRELKALYGQNNPYFRLRWDTG
jgi:hypothetical protein